MVQNPRKITEDSRLFQSKSRYQQRRVAVDDVRGEQTNGVENFHWKCDARS